MAAASKSRGASRQLSTGNGMTAQGAIAAGCNFFSGYPITPSSEIYATMMRELPRRGGLAVGAPDEITALSYAVGASMTGCRAMTATSGPGWSLMIETTQYALMTEIPIVIVVVQRLGPATGGATQGGQGDLLLVEHATSGGYPIPVLAPVDGLDCYRLTGEAFRIAEKLRTPVVLLSDKEVATTVEDVELCELPQFEVEARESASRSQPHLSYQINDLKDVPAFAPVGGEQIVTMTGSAHNQRGELKKNDPETLRMLRHLETKISSRAEELEQVRWHRKKDSQCLLLSYGISARSCRDAVNRLAKRGIPTDLLEVLSLFPIPRRSIQKAAEGKNRILVVEENLTGLYAREVESILRNQEVERLNGIGATISPNEIEERFSS